MLEILYTKAVLPVEKVLTLNSVPVTILPAVEGKAYIPLFWTGLRAGAPFKSCPGTLVVRTLGAFGWGTATPATFLTAAGDESREVSVVALGRAAIDLRNREMQVFVNAGDPTADESAPGSKVTIELYYVLVPIS